MSPRRRKNAAAGRASAAPAAGRTAAVATSVVTRSTHAWMIAAVIALLTIVVFAQVSSHTFISVDDGEYVSENPHVNTGLSAENVRWAFTTGHAGNWHPLTWLSLQADVSGFGSEPGPLHAANLAWHVLDTVLLFGLLRSMTGSLWRSAFVAALFGVHPAHVESVAWVAERKDVLSAAFWFGATWSYVAWTRRPAAWRYALTMALLALGLMAKPMLVTLPATLLLLDIWPLNRTSVPWTRRVVEKLPLFAVVVASSAITLIVQRRAMASLELVPWPLRFENAVVSSARYLGTLLWPANLAVLYPLRPLIPVAAIVASAVMLAALTWACWRARRTQPFLLIGWLWFLGTLVPVIGLVQVGIQAMADRYTYIPSIGIFLAAVWGVGALAGRLRISAALAGGAGAAIVALLAVAAYRQTALWATNETLWQHAVEVTTDNPRAHIELGVVYGKQGRHPEAEAQFNLALQSNLGPLDAKDLFRNLAGALIAQGRVAEALPHLEQAVTLNPDRADVRHQLGLIYARTGRPDDAAKVLRDAIRIDPAFEESYLALGVILATNGHPDEGRQVLTELLRRNPARKDARDALARISGK